MEEFKPGDEYYHKATRKRCVVIKVNDDGTVKVRNQDDAEKDYYPHELKKRESAIVHRKKGYLY